MAEFPSNIYEARETENLNGIVFDADDKKNFFSEDFQGLGAEITAIETYLKTLYDLITTQGGKVVILNGNVGIGTATPSQKLQIVGGDVLVDNTKGLMSLNGAGTAARFVYGDAGNNAYFTALASDGDTYVYAGGGVGFVIKNTSGRVGIGTASPTAKLDVMGDKLRLRIAKTPSSANDTGNEGDMCWDTSYLYVCTATNTWKRISLNTW